jgi:isocitrate dehydrogenase
MAFLAQRAASAPVAAGARRQQGSTPSSPVVQRRAKALVARAAGSSSHKIAVLPGDGIGPEITDVALRVLELAGKKEGHSFQFTTELIGGAAIDATGSPLPDKTLDTCKASDSVLLAAIGG